MAQTLYVVAYLASATDPADDATGHAQIKAGQDGSGASAAWAGSTAWTGSGTYLDPTGLSDGTLYATAAVVYDDVALTYSNRVLATETRTQYLLTAAAGSFTLTGVAAALTHNRYLAAATGAFTLTGNSATLTYTPAGAYSMTAETGSFSLTGNAASLTATHNPLTAGTGAFTLTGNDAAFVYSRALVAETGTFTLTGSDAALSTTGTVEAPAADVQAVGGWAEYERKRRKYERTADDVQAERERIGVVEPKPKKQARPKVSKPAPKPVSAPETIPQIHGRDLALWIEMLNGDIQDAGGENIPDVAQMVSMRNAAMQRQDEEDMAVVITTIAAMV